MLNTNVPEWVVNLIGRIVLNQEAQRLTEMITAQQAAVEAAAQQAQELPSVEGSKPRVVKGD